MLDRVKRGIDGHWFTLWPFVRDTLRPPAAPRSRIIRVEVPDSLRGTVTLTANQSATRSDTVLLIVHGLGGSATSPYAVHAAREAERAGIASVRLNLRGADRRGEDVYHAGLTADLHATLASPELAAYAHVLVVGYSLGGHVSLRFATEQHDPRVRGVVAVCPPLDLAKSAAALDEPRLKLYRHHVLAGLKEIFVETARYRPMPIDVREVMEIQTIRAWDEKVVAQRFAFGSAEAYWASQNVGSRLHEVRVPSLIVVAEEDPMIPIGTVRPSLEAAAHCSLVRPVYVRGGHVGFPSATHLGIAGADAGLDAQVMRFLTALR